MSTEPTKDAIQAWLQYSLHADCTIPRATREVQDAAREAFHAGYTFGFFAGQQKPEQHADDFRCVQCEAAGGFANDDGEMLCNDCYGAWREREGLDPPAKSYKFPLTEYKNEAIRQAFIQLQHVVDLTDKHLASGAQLVTDPDTGEEVYSREWSQMAKQLGKESRELIEFITTNAEPGLVNPGISGAE